MQFQNFDRVYETGQPDLGPSPYTSTHLNILKMDREQIFKGVNLLNLCNKLAHLLQIIASSERGNQASMRGKRRNYNESIAFSTNTKS